MPEESIHSHGREKENKGWECNYLKSQSRMMKYYFFTVKCLLSCSTSVVFTVKVVWLIVPLLAQMTFTKACYKLGLSHLAGEMSGKFKYTYEKSKRGFQRMAISQWTFNLDT